VLDAEADKSSGFGVVRFNKRLRTITVECWPLLADPTRPGTQFPGWPVTVGQLDNYARAAAAHLPEITVRGAATPVVEVIEESTGERLYALRLPGATWRPFTFSPGPHTIRVSDPETGRSAELPSVPHKQATPRRWRSRCDDGGMGDRCSARPRAEEESEDKP
jgi:hypothetical protein